jgi:hypothetical protein
MLQVFAFVASINKIMRLVKHLLINHLELLQYYGKSKFIKASVL